MKVEGVLLDDFKQQKIKISAFTSDVRHAAEGGYGKSILIPYSPIS